MADKKIVDLNQGVALTANDYVVLVQGNETLKISGQDVAWGVKTLANLADKAYVDAIVAGAPELLDTLNELAAAIGDDPNFGASIRTLLDSKLPTANFGLEFWNALAGVTTYHIVEDTNLYFTTQRARASVFDNNDLINFENGGQVGNAQLVHQGYSLPGMDVYSPDGHEWVQLNYADRNYIWVTDSFAGVDVGTHSWKFNSDGTLTLASDPTDATHAATKSYVDSQVNNIEIPLSLNDLTNVSITNPSANQVLKFNGSAWVNGNDDSGTGSGGYPTAPTFTSVTTTQLNVQNVAFTGTGAVTISSGNDLNLTAVGEVMLNGKRTISLVDLKSVVAASTDFADFKARIAAL